MSVYVESSYSVRDQIFKSKALCKLCLIIQVVEPMLRQSPCIFLHNINNMRYLLIFNHVLKSS